MTMIGKIAPASMGSRVRVTFIEPGTGERIPAVNAATGESIWGGEWHPNMITDEGLDAYAATATAAMRMRLSLSGALPDIKEQRGAAEQAGSTVTAISGTFTAEDVGRAIVWGDGSNARIVAVNSATSAEVDKAQAVAAQVFEVWHVEISNLPDVVATASATFPEVSTAHVDDGYYVEELAGWRQITLTANANVNGFGLAANTGPDALIIENIRDASGQPITVSLLAGKAIRVDHVLTLRYPQEYQTADLHIDEYDAANQFVGRTTRQVDMWLAAGDLSGTGIRYAMNAIRPAAAPATTSDGRGSAFLNAATLTPGIPNIGNPPIWGQSSGYASSWIDPYVPGARRRAKGMRAQAQYANGEVHGMVTRHGTGQTGGVTAFGIVMQFHEPFLKENTHTLSIGYEVSWDRDYSVS